MKKKVDHVVETVRLLDQTTRVLQAMSMLLDVMAFGQRQIERRLFKLECQQRRKRK